ncbi:metallophosphoesterase [Pseudogracilibacillus sp. SE30717A]|uniref:metallophosphoesterase family protein n=1 Tax=Pseudogracilibacillus sp. SE30717A TaxID=3098293 RepID=UPI00300DF2BD
MNNVLIVSDSHGLTKELEAIKERHQVEKRIHCGDSELPSDAASLHGYLTVKGNCDWQATFSEEHIIEIGGLRFLVTHGHLNDVKSTLLPLQYRAQEVQADIVCFGHTHIAYAEKIGEQLFLNPGSLRLPKYFNIPSYVIVSWEYPTDVTITFYYLNGDVITKFPYEKYFFIKK